MNCFRITLTISILMIVGGFLSPPVGIIDGSVITAVGLLLGFAVISQIPALLSAAGDGQSIRLKKGDFSAEVTRADIADSPSPSVMD